MRVLNVVTVVACYMSVCSGQRGGTDTRLGLIADQLGVAPVPGVSPQGRPGGQSGQINQFPPGSGGGGIFQQPPNFNPVGGNGINGGGGGGFNSGCRCLPPNQVCPANTRRTENTGIRIANQNGPQCPGQQLCCSNGARPNNPPNANLIGPGPVIARPSQPNCGLTTLPPSSNPLEAGFGEFPWMVVITGVNNEYIGGGALISNNVVLTAAHKIHNRSPQSLRLRVGDHNVATAQDHPTYRHEQRSVQRILLHPQFSINNLHNDVALLYLSQPINTNQPHIGSVCLPEQGQLFSPQRCWVTGWGENAFKGGQFQSVLKKVDVPIWDPFVCEQRLRTQPRLGHNFNLDKTSFLCAGGEPGKDACTGDGGAPLVCQGNNNRFAVVGLVAWGIGCAQRDIPGVYVNVANYADFIKRNAGL